MIVWRLFLTFLEIGAVSFGGGYGMISLIRERVLANGWLTEAQLLNLIAVSESTPGPIAVNIATFVGSSQAGVWGALAATVAVTLPAFVIMLLIVTVIRNFLKYRPIQAALDGVRPCVVGMILATGGVMLLRSLIGMQSLTAAPTPDVAGLLILAMLVGGGAIWKRWRGKAPAPIVMILISAGLGMILYPLWS